MEWGVNARIVGGESGPVNLEPGEAVQQGDRVRFELFLRDARQSELDDASRYGNWVEPPVLTVRGADGTAVQVRAQRNDPLVIEYQFRWEGTKTLWLRGRAREVTFPTAQMHSERSSRSTLFDDLNLPPVELYVEPLERRGRGELATTSGGRSGASARSRDRQVRAERAARREREEARQRAEREYMAELEALMYQARRSQNESRQGAVVFDFLSHQEILNLSTEEASQYALELQAALNVTHVLDISRGGAERYGEGAGLSVVPYTWRYTFNGNQVTFYKQAAEASTGDMVGGRPLTYPHPREAQLRSESEVTFALDDWVYIRVSGRPAPALFQAADAAAADGWERFLSFLDAIDTVMTVFDILLPVVALARHAYIRGIITIARRVGTGAGRRAARQALRAARARRGRLALEDLVSRRVSSARRGRPRRRLAGRRGSRRPASDATRRRRLQSGVRGNGDRGLGSSRPRRPGSQAEASPQTPPASQAGRGTRSRLTGPQVVHGGRLDGPRLGGAQFDADVDQVIANVDDIFDRMAAGTLPRTVPAPAPSRLTFPNIAKLKGLTARARAAFNKIRDGFAQRLGLRARAGGQVHHAIELDVLKRYPGVFTEAEINSFRNMRGIPPERSAADIMDARRVRKQLHNSAIRRAWNRHYDELDRILERRLADASDPLQIGNDEYRRTVRTYLETARDEIDHLMGQFFSEYRMGSQVRMDWTPNPNSVDLTTMDDDVAPDLPPALRP